MTTTMTPSRILAAYRAVLELSNIILPYKAARSVMALKKRLADENDTVVDMEKKLAVEFGGEEIPGGAYEFPDVDTNVRFQEALKEAKEQEDDIRLPTVDLSKYTSLIRISPASIEALDGIVIFEKGPKQEEEDIDG